MTRKQIQTTLKTSPALAALLKKTDTPASYTAIPCGFDWGALRVTRLVSRKGYVVLGLDTNVDGLRHRLDVRVTPTGRNITVTDWDTGKAVRSTAKTRVTK